MAGEATTLSRHTRDPILSVITGIFMDIPEDDIRSNNPFDPDFAGPSEWARMYRSYGLQIVPARMPIPGGEWKMPALVSWTEFQENLIPQATFDRWYGNNGEHIRRQNMGILTGHCSGNVFVIDLDDQKGPEPQAWWHSLLELHNNGIDPETVQQRTGGGGRQKLFRAPPDWRAPTNKTAINVDIRGQGGFAMMTPSRHESGTEYVWLPGCAPWETEIADAPEWLLEAIDILIVKHGNRPRAQHTASPETRTNAFGTKIVEGRESYMRDMIWRVVLDWYRECPIGPPPAADNAAKRDEAWLVYESCVGTRILEEGLSNADGLERENRGYSMFANKWRREMKNWGSPKMTEAAKHDPKSDDIKPKLDPAAGETIRLHSAFPIQEAAIPVRDWVIPGLLLRRNLSVLVAPPASGKSLLTLQMAIAVALGMAWGGWFPRKPEKVLVINAEDDLDEMRRRLFAAARSMGVDQASLVDRVFLVDAPESIVIARMDARSKSVIRTPLIEQLVDIITQNGIGLVIADPFAETFEGDENSNSEVKWAGILWREVARRTLTALWLVHHTKKYAGDMAGNADASRGGGALIGTARILSTLFTMTEDEATLFNVPPEERDQYVRFDDAKANHSAKGRVRWFRKITVSLNNGAGLIPGDDVGVLEPWKPPGVMDGVTAHELGLALETIGRGVMDDNGRPTGQLFGPTIMSKDRFAGRVLEQLLGIPEERSKQMIKAWLESGALYTVEYDDPQQRKTRTGVKFDPAKRPDIVAEVFK